MQTLASRQPSPIEREIGRLQASLQAGRFDEARVGAEAILAIHPHNRDALYVFAVSLRYLNTITDALTALERLERAHPNFSRLYQERGHCYIALKDASRAVDAFIQAVNLNPALPASWNKLTTLHQMLGQTENARLAAQHVATLSRLPPEIVTATGLYSDGDFAIAEAIARRYLLEHGDHVEAMRLLARIGLALDVLDDGEILLEAVLKLAPDYTAARLDYATALLRRHKHAQARTEMETLLASEPENRTYLMTYASVLVGLGEHDQALAIYQRLLNDIQPPASKYGQTTDKYHPFREEALLHLSVAHCLKTLGRQAEAVEAYRAAATARADFGDAYWSLANLKTYTFDESEIVRMRASEDAATTQLTDRYHLCFALGKCLEDTGDYAESFQFYDRGNALKRSEHAYDVSIIERNTRAQIEVCRPALFKRLAHAGAPAADPIFIVGLPRSGSTLLEQILASHSQVDGTAELADIQRIVLELQGRQMEADDLRYPAVLADIAPEELLRFGNQYLNDTRAYRTGKPYFIDKMPNNFRHVGLIHLILPNAKIIDARRDPVACCFSNFKQLFASGQEFTYSIDDIARYYRTYVELMAHWDQVLPGRVLRVQHEDVVNDLEGNVRRILDYCGLPFEQGCLEFHKTKRSIRTASSEQVRQPIFRDSLDQWQHFEPWLGPLKAALGDLVTR